MFETFWREKHSLLMFEDVIVFFVSPKNILSRTSQTYLKRNENSAKLQRKCLHELWSRKYAQIMK